MTKYSVTKKMVPVTTMKEVYTFNVEFSEEEVQALLAVLNNVGGHPDDTPRAYIDEVRMRLECALDDNDIRQWESEYDYDFRSYEHTLSFKPVTKSRDHDTFGLD